MMYEKILVTLDGSELAEQSLLYAEDLVAKLGSEIHLLQVSDTGESGIHDFQVMYVNQIAQRVDRWLHKSNQTNLKITPAVVMGSAADEITKYAENNGIGLIIMGTHGRSGLTRWAVGSVANKVVRGTEIPVLLTRSKPAGSAKEVQIISKVLVPLDGSDIGENALPAVIELARRTGMEVVLFQAVPLAFHVYPAGDMVSQVPYSEREMEPIKGQVKGYLDNVVKRLTGLGLKVSQQMVVGNPEEAIIKKAEEIKVDLVAMSTHGRSGVSRWVFGSVADRVLSAGTTPLLLVRATEKSGKKK
jgi:nucleotide-binding universal stress UspA family protein